MRRGERKAYFGILATERYKGQESELLTHEIRKDQDHPFWRTGGRDQDYLMNSGIVSWEVEAFSLQSPES
jgi:hypothetical protein